MENIFTQYEKNKQGGDNTTRNKMSLKKQTKSAYPLLSSVPLCSP